MNSYVVVDPSDPLVQDFLHLNDHRLRQERELPGGDMAGFFLAEGDHVIERGISAGHVLSTLLVDANRKKPLPSFIPETVKILLCGEAVITAISGRASLRDPIGSFIRPSPLSFSQVIQLSTTVVVTERVTNPTNMGSLFRNASALDADLVCLDSTSCDPLYRRAVRVSMGQVFAINHVRIPRFLEGLEVLKSSGFTRLALTPDNGALDIAEISIKEETPVALLVGAEGSGLTKSALQRCDYQIRIPMSRNVDSLNVGTAAAVALYAIREARRI
tara:strand:+ start:125 stop:946 length:822 start_codon:yes stop_codon:yes gene_type:complete